MMNGSIELRTPGYKDPGFSLYFIKDRYDKIIVVQLPAGSDIVQSGPSFVKTTDGQRSHDFPPLSQEGGFLVENRLFRETPGRICPWCFALG
jgi:hypothetical protein